MAADAVLPVVYLKENRYAVDFEADGAIWRFYFYALDDLTESLVDAMPRLDNRSVEEVLDGVEAALEVMDEGYDDLPTVRGVSVVRREGN